jgi:hypothetical protein
MTILTSPTWRNFGVFGMACFRWRQDLPKAAVISCRCCKTASVSLSGSPEVPFRLIACADGKGSEGVLS